MKNLATIFTLAFLTLGLISCGSDVKEVLPPTPEQIKTDALLNGMKTKEEELSQFVKLTALTGDTYEAGSYKVEVDADKEQALIASYPLVIKKLVEETIQSYEEVNKDLVANKKKEDKVVTAKKKALEQYKYYMDRTTESKIADASKDLAVQVSAMGLAPWSKRFEAHAVKGLVISFDDEGLKSVKEIFAADLQADLSKVTGADTKESFEKAYGIAEKLFKADKKEQLGDGESFFRLITLYVMALKTTEVVAPPAEPVK